MVVCLENTKGVHCTPTKDVSPQMIATSHFSIERKSYQELKNRKKDPATWSHATNPSSGGSSYPVAGIATIPSADGAA